MDQTWCKDEIHSFTIDGQGYLLQVTTGRAFKVDDLTQAIVSLPDAMLQGDEPALSVAGFRAEEIAVALQELKETGLILRCAEREMRDVALKEKFLSLSRDGSEAKLGYLMLNVAEDCNLSCAYCYADSGKYQGSGVLMTRAVGEAALDYLFAEAQGQKRCECTFFGGEPLLNFPLIKHLVAYGKQRAAEVGMEIGFGMTTNGTLLSEEVVAFLDEHRFGILVSVDGPRETHDMTRRFRGGAGSYDQVVGGVSRLLRCKNIKLGSRSTVTPCDLDLIKIARHMSEEIGFGMFHLEPATFGPFTPGGPLVMREEEVVTYNERFAELVRFVLVRIGEGDIPGFHVLYSELNKLHRAEKRIRPCGMGTTLRVVSANGDVYACHRLVGLKEHCLGSILGKTGGGAIKRFAPTLVPEKDECSKCWARYVCGGDCPSEVMILHGDDRGYAPLRCLVRKHHLEWITWLYANLKELGQPVLERVLRVGDYDRSAQGTVQATSVPA